jgi:hypothetical protein
VELPTIRVIPISSALIHESLILEKVHRLASIIESDGIQKNPIIVSPVEGGARHLVIDGIHRAEALRELGCVSVVASLVVYADPSIELGGWSRAFLAAPAEEVLALFEGASGSKPRRREPGEAARDVSAREATFGLALRDGRAFAFPASGFDLERWAALDRAVVEGAAERGIACRPVADDEGSDVFARDEDVTSLCLRPVLTKGEVVRMALAGTPVPADTTRHIIQNRPLGLNTPLGLLKAHVPVDVATKILEAEVQNRWTKGAIRHYPDSVYIYDE